MKAKSRKKRDKEQRKKQVAKKKLAPGLLSSLGKVAAGLLLLLFLPHCLVAQSQKKTALVRPYPRCSASSLPSSSLSSPASRALCWLRLTPYTHRTTHDTVAVDLPGPSSSRPTSLPSAPKKATTNPLRLTSSSSRPTSHPSTQRKRPSVVQRRPSAQRKRSSTLRKRPSSLRKRPSSLRKRSSSLRKRPSTQRKRSSTPQRRSPALRLAVVSYRFPQKKHPLYRYLGRYRRSFTYDNGLMLALLALNGRCRLGEGLVRTLDFLQNRDGSWGFSFDSWNNNFYNRRYVRAGTVAWVGYGLALFAGRCRSLRAWRCARRAASYLRSLVIQKEGDLRQGLYRGGRGRWSLDYRRFYARYQMQGCVAEHQFDIFFFLRQMAQLSRRPYAREARLLAQAILHRLWLPQEGRFAAGVSSRAVDRSQALDSAGAWGALFLLARSRKDLARRCLRFSERRFRLRYKGVWGYRPYAGKIPDYPDVDWEQKKLLFLEGTASMALAYHHLGQRRRARQILAQLHRLLTPQGALPYALGKHRDFPQIPAASSTLWFLFASLASHNHPTIRAFWAPSLPPSPPTPPPLRTLPPSQKRQR